MDKFYGGGYWQKVIQVRHFSHLEPTPPLFKLCQMDFQSEARQHQDRVKERSKQGGRRPLIGDDLWPPSFNQLEFQGPYGLTKVFTVHTHTRFVDLLQINLIQTPTTVGFPPRPPQRQPLTTLLGFNYFFEVGTDKKFFLCDTHTYIKVNIRTH